MSFASRAAAIGTLAAVFATALPSLAAAQQPCVYPRQMGIVFVVDDSGSMLDNDPDDPRAVRVQRRGSTLVVRYRTASAYVLVEARAKRGGRAVARTLVRARGGRVTLRARAPGVAVAAVGRDLVASRARLVRVRR
jgi:hypothetical protein